MHPFLITLFVLTPGLGLAAAETVAEPPQGVTLVNARQLTEIADRIPDLVVIDARIAADRRQGYIEGSLSLPNVTTECATLARLVPARRQPVAFYCNGVRCGRSLDAVQRARDCGYTQLYWFRGGFEEWLAEGYPFVKE